MARKAVISSGNHQYLVKVGDQLAVDKLESGQASGSISFKPLLIIDDDQVLIGQPELTDKRVRAQVVEPVIREAKVVSIRFRAKKRIHKRRTSRAQKTILAIKAIDPASKKAPGSKRQNPDG